MKLILLKTFLVALGFFILIFSKAYPNNADSLVNIIETTENEYEKVRLLNELSKQYRKTGKYEQSIATANKALEIAKWNDYKMEVIATYMNLGHSYTYYTNYSKALEQYLLATQYLKKTPDDIILAKAYMNIALIYNILENPHDALLFNTKAHNLIKRLLNNELLINCYTNFSDSYGLLKDYKNQILFLKKGVETRRKTGELDKIGIEFNKIGSAFWMLQSYDSSFHYFNYYLEASIRATDSIGIARAYNNIGSVWVAKNQYNEAREYYNKSLSIQQPIVKESSYLGLVEVYSQKNDLKAASHYFELARKEKADLNKLAKACGFLIDGYKKAKNSDQTIFYLETLTAIKNEAHQIYLSDFQSMIKAKYEVQGIEERLAEKETRALLKEVSALKSTQNHFLLTILVLTFIIAVSVIYLFRKRLVEKEKRLLFFEKNVIEMGKHLKDMTDIMARK